MTLPASGQISFSDIRTEFGGGTGQISFADFYRGAAANKVRNNAANNPTTNLAAGVPTSGQLAVSSFYSQARGFKKTYSAGATSQNGNVIFGDDWAVDYPKDITINSGVELGTTNTGDWALELNSGAAGTITVNNAGTITGAGGAANSGAGGDAIRVNCSNVTITNTGTIRGGGGGGGRGGNGGTGGTGGQGKTDFCDGVCTGGTRNCSAEGDGCPGSYCGYSTSQGDYCWNYLGAGGMGSFIYCCTTPTLVIYSGGAGGSGGSGGNGGVGIGYSQARTGGSGGSAGSAGSAGGTNAGAGGTGGSGGTGGGGSTSYGAAGSSGSSGNTGGTGANGNYSNGSAGSAGAGGSGGGAAGRAVQVDVAYTMSNSGTIQGAYT